MITQSSRAKGKPFRDASSQLATACSRHRQACYLPPARSFEHPDCAGMRGACEVRLQLLPKQGGTSNSRNVCHSDLMQEQGFSNEWNHPRMIELRCVQ